MSTVTCPHCGFNNFSISAYCSNCERPLQSDAAAKRPAPRPQQAAPRPAPASQSGQLPSATQVAQQILQRRPPVPAAQQTAPLPPASQVAQQILQKRSAEMDTSIEPTVVARVPVEMQRALVAERGAAAPSRVVVQNRPPLQAMSPHDDLTRNPAAEDRTAADPDAATAVFTAPALFDKRAKPDVVHKPVAAPQVRAAAPPSLPQPVQARAAVPLEKEPAPKPQPRKPVAAPAHVRPAAPQPRPESPFPKPESPFPRTEPGMALRDSAAPQQVLRQGAAPAQRPAPKPPAAAAAASGALESAAGWRILLGYAVDIALLVGFFALFVNLDAAITGPKGLDAHGKTFEFLANHPGSTLRAAILTMLAGTAYHVILNHLNGRTLGRMVAGTALARRSGRPMSWIIVSIRTVATFVSLLAFGAGFFWAIVDKRGRAFHDLVSGTLVVRHHRA